VVDVDEVSDHGGVSHYANYGALAASYDATREATGVELVLGCLSIAGQRLDAMSVLDAGCGTGNYSSVIAHYVARVTGLDRSPEMLSIAATKLVAHRPERVALVPGELRELPFAAGTFDGVIAVQVLHHLDPPGDRERPCLRKAMAEFARVLRPGGVLVIGTCSHLQLARAFWHLDLLPRAAREVRRRYPRLHDLAHHLEEAGFVHVGNAVPTEAILQGDAYLDAAGPLRADWRDGDSSWALASEEEIGAAIERVRAATARGDAWRLPARRERWRRALGQMTFVYASRQNNPVVRNPDSHAGWRTHPGLSAITR
jgi:SAM-dependent methyltransferase